MQGRTSSETYSEAHNYYNRLQYTHIGVKLRVVIAKVSFAKSVAITHGFTL